MKLGFKIVRRQYEPRSGLQGTYEQKIRDDGRFGSPVGDEVTLWDALQEALDDLKQTEAELVAEQQAREAAEEQAGKLLQECLELRRQVDAHAARIAAQSELLSHAAEKPEKKGGKK